MNQESPKDASMMVSSTSSEYVTADSGATTMTPMRITSPLARYTSRSEGRGRGLLFVAVSINPQTCLRSLVGEA